MSDIEVLHLIGLKMFYAVMCGSLVGIERKLNDASAGFKTQILVCVGSMLFTVIPVMVSGKLDDSGMRVIAQLVSGIGFLGAGAILHSGTHHVVGLTTAAWIWFTAAIGVIIGIGHGPVAVFTASTLVGVITVARKIERRHFSQKSNFSEDTHSGLLKSVPNPNDENKERSAS